MTPAGPAHLRPVGETEFAVAQAERAAGRGIGVCQGIVSWADLTSGPKVETDRVVTNQNDTTAAAAGLGALALAGGGLVVARRARR